MKSLLLVALLCAACEAPTSPSASDAPSFLTLPCAVMSGATVNPCARPTIDPVSRLRPMVPQGVIQP